jgi:hypothetical protein
MTTDKEFMQKIGEKKLTDIALVAYLASKGYKMSRIDKGRDKSVFYFEDVDDIEKEILKYFNHEALVDPLKFSETLRNLRSYAKQG